MREAMLERSNPIFLDREKPGSSAEIKPHPRLSEAEFYKFSANNPDLRVELNKNGTLIIMPPVDCEGGEREGHTLGMLYSWWLTHQKGRVFSPSTAFTLPDGEVRAADGAWVSAEKLANLPASERKKFARLVPDFVIEVRSSSDRISKLKSKMSDIWIKNGVQLGWLLDPKTEKAYIYRADGSVEEMSGFDKTLSGADICPGFLFDLTRLRV